MHPKLQQAIVATRSGRKKDAQHLLIDTLRDNPAEADAWYLLSQLVESEKRQVSYLKKTVEIDPGHPKAKQRLMQLGEIPVPAPIFSEEREPVLIVAEEETSTTVETALQEEPPSQEGTTSLEGTTSQEPKKPQVASRPITPQPTRINKQKPRSENAKIDTEWRRTAGQPVTEKAVQPAKAAQSVKTPDNQKDIKPTETNKPTPWLTILLLIILVGILGLFGYWLYLFFFNSF